MPRPLSTTQLYAFATPVVKGADLILPVTVGAGVMHGLSAPVERWRQIARRVLDATSPEALHKSRLSSVKRPPNLVEAAAVGAPITKPGGQLL